MRKPESSSHLITWSISSSCKTCFLVIKGKIHIFEDECYYERCCPHCHPVRELFEEVAHKTRIARTPCGIRAIEKSGIVVRYACARACFSSDASISV